MSHSVRFIQLGLFLPLLASCSLQQAPQMPQTVRMQSNSVSQSNRSQSSSTLFVRLDLNQNKTLSFIEFSQLGQLAVHGVGSLGPSSLESLQASTFKLYDRNADSQLQADEFQSYQNALTSLNTQSLFNRLNQNRSQSLTFSQWQGLGVLGIHGVSSGLASQPLSQRQQQEMTFQQLDRNADKLLSIQEFTPYSSLLLALFKAQPTSARY